MAATVGDLSAAVFGLWRKATALAGLAGREAAAPDGLVDEVRRLGDELERRIEQAAGDCYLPQPERWQRG